MEIYGSQNKRKGQYQIIIEMLLVLVGIMIAGYTVSLFTDVKTGANTIAVRDSFTVIADQVVNGVVKASATPNSIQRIRIPGKIAETSYKITLDGAGNVVNVTSLGTGGIIVAKQIFNIGQPNRIRNSEVSGSSLIVEVVSEAGEIRIRRGNWTS